MSYEFIHLIKYLPIMKRILFFLAAAAAMTACSQDETTDLAGKGPGIDFRAALTRATETTTDNLQKIVVTALDASQANYFTDVEFTKSGSFFTSADPYYWPSDGSSLTFHAYAPTAAELGGTVTIDQNTKQLADYAPASDITAQQDFITATATGSKTNAATGVALTFSHRLAQIEIKAKSDNNTYIYKVQGIRIAQPVSKATFDFGTTQWTPGAEKANYDVTYEGSERTLTGTAATLMAADGNNAMLIPQQLVAWDPAGDASNTKKGAYLAVKINITTKEGTQIYPEQDGGYGWAAVAIDTNWEAGKKYVYTLDFTNGAGKVDPEDPDNPGEDILGSPIKFTVTVDEWQDAAAEDVEM